MIIKLDEKVYAIKDILSGSGELLMSINEYGQVMEIEEETGLIVLYISNKDKEIYTTEKNLSHTPVTMLDVMKRKSK